jgi:hypothetical protein
VTAAAAAGAQVNVTTYHNDNARTGQNLNESYLVPQNVNTNQFGKLFAQSIDGLPFAQPLYVSNVNVSGRARNIVYVATERDNVYAFDADNANLGPIWTRTFTDSTKGIAPGSSSDTGAFDVGPDIGITGTPVIDTVTGTMYLVATTKETVNGTSTYYQRLHALDITTGAEKLGGPVAINASVPGIGDSSSAGVVTFSPVRHGQRPGLLLLNGVVYICWASHGDNRPYHGWVIGYDAGTLNQVAVLNTTPNKDSGGIWESADGPAVDSSGFMYIVTGNGIFDANSAGKDYGDSYLKIDPTARLGITDYFTPFDEDFLNQQDLDVGSGGAVVVPDQAGLHPHILVGGSKNGSLYVIDRDRMGRFSSSGNSCLQTLNSVIKGVFSNPAYYNGHIYYMASGYQPSTDTLKAFAINSGVLNPIADSQSNIQIGYPGATPSISANGSKGGVVWLIDPNYATSGSQGPAILRAFDASNVAQEVYDSTKAPGNVDQPGLPVKWATPTIANGKVYVATAGQLDVYGLKANSLTPLLSMTLSKAAVVGGEATTGIVNLEQAAPSAGAIVNLASDNPNVIVPPSVTITPGNFETTFTVGTSSVGSKITATITATSGGVSKSQSVDVLPPNPSGFTLLPPPTVTAGTSALASDPGSGTIVLNATQSTNVTFTLTSSDPKAFNPSSPVTVYAASTQASFGFTSGFVSTTHNVTITAKWRATGATQTATVTVKMLPGTTFPAGVNFFSVPMDYNGTDTTLDAIFGYGGVKLAVWDPANLIWDMTPTPPADMIHPGEAYWAKFPTPIILQQTGALTDTTKDFVINLASGWNQIGNPFTVPVTINALKFSLGRLSFSAASGANYHLISPNVYRYDTTQKQYVLVSPTQPLNPGTGYWLLAFDAVDMTIPHP